MLVFLCRNGAVLANRDYRAEPGISDGSSVQPVTGFRYRSENRLFGGFLGSSHRIIQARGRT